jgi:hypothetical protein
VTRKPFRALAWPLFLGTVLGAVAAVPGARAADPDPAEACRAARAFLGARLDPRVTHSIEPCDTATVAGRGARWVAVFRVETADRQGGTTELTFRVILAHAPDMDPPWRLELIAAK